MAQSQQEYLDSLRTKATTSSPAKRSSGAKSTTHSQHCDQNRNIPSDGSSSSSNASAGSGSNSNSTMDDS